MGGAVLSVLVVVGASSQQMTPNGRLFAVVGEEPAMRARLVHSEAPGALVASDLFETVIAPLANAATPARFEF